MAKVGLHSFISVMYNHNNDFYHNITIIDDRVDRPSLFPVVIFAREPSEPRTRKDASAEVPTAQSFHSFSVDGKAPSSSQVEEIIVDLIAICLSRQDDIRQG